MFGLVLVAVLAGPWLLIGIAMWSANGSWDFETRGLTHWLLMRGSRLDRLGLVEPQSAPVRYSVSLPEGTFPGWRIAQYASRAAPTTVGQVYAERCRAMNLKITQKTEEGGRFVLVCEIEPYLDVEMVAERSPSNDATRVTLKVWGSD